MQAPSVVERSSLGRTYTQIAVALIAVLIQYGLLMLFSASAQRSSGLIHETLVGCIAATILGIFIVRGVSKYPGVEATGYVVPGFVISYGLVLVIFIFSRLEYSRILIASSFFINLIISLLLFSITGRRTILKIGVVPAGNFEEILGVNRVEWHILSDPCADVTRLDAIAADFRATMSDAWERAITNFALNNIPVYHSKHLQESLTGKVELQHLSENTFGTLSPLYAYMKVKRILDTLAAAIAVLFLSPAFAIIALTIRIDSSGPAFFRQVRVGYQGKRFTVIKFRTMTTFNPADSEVGELDAAKTKVGDQRVTRFGAFLRRTRLDELPQILNVLRGEMSWIGPRPEAEILSRWYEKEIPFYQYRHIVRPGITGWAQVNQGHVSEVEEVANKLHFDFYYIKNFSPWIDLLIIVRTIKIMITGFGAR